MTDDRDVRAGVDVVVVGVPAAAAALGGGAPAAAEPLLPGAAGVREPGDLLDDGPSIPRPPGGASGAARGGSLGLGGPRRTGTRTPGEPVGRRRRSPRRRGRVSAGTGGEGRKGEEGRRTVGRLKEPYEGDVGETERRLGGIG